MDSKHASSSAASSENAVVLKERWLCEPSGFLRRQLLEFRRETAAAVKQQLRKQNRAVLKKSWLCQPSPFLKQNLEQQLQPLRVVAPEKTNAVVLLEKRDVVQHWLSKPPSAF